MLPTASERPDFLELHDAVVASFTVLEDSSAVLRFSHLCAYRAESPGSFGVWSHGATLTLSGVEALAFEGPWRLAAQGDAVDYAFVSPASAEIEGEGVSEGVEIPPAALLDGGNDVRLYMRWGSGARLEIAAARAILELSGGERFETFIDGGDGDGGRDD